MTPQVLSPPDSSTFSATSFEIHVRDPLSKTIIKDIIAPAEQNSMAEFIAPKSVNVSSANSPAKAPTIPLIDLDAIDRAQGDLRKELIHALGNGLRDVGFVAIKAESLMPLVQGVFAQSRAYFHQDLQEKMRDVHGNAGHTGYSPMGSETAAGAQVHDLKEHFHIPPNLDKWPNAQKLPQFKLTMEQYHRKLASYMSRIMQLLIEYLGEETESIEKSMEDPLNLLRLIRYPTPSSNDIQGAVRSARHKDLNLLTILPPSTAPGLQLLTKEGAWLDIVTPNEYVILNTGEQIERKTAGYIQATEHQVLNPTGAWANSERFAAVFFGSWSGDFSLAPFPSCIEKVCAKMSEEDKNLYLKKYQDVTVLENLDSRLIELGFIKNPGEDKVKALKEKGLLQQAPSAVKDAHPHLFN